jgi:phosphomethylpyrimidine synthase
LLKRITLKEQLQRKKFPPYLKKIAKEENIEVEKLVQGILKGSIVILRNAYQPPQKIKAIGEGLKVKINANIGTSPEEINLRREVLKLKKALQAGADTIMDLSIGGDTLKIRRVLIENCPVPLGTVPIYEAALAAIKKKGSVVKMTEEEMFAAVERQARDGVSFMTIHAGLTQETLQRLSARERTIEIVSRGGSILAEWMIYNKKENPFYVYYDKLLELAREFEIVLSLGDGLRPGCLSDASDSSQFQELIILGELTQRAWKKGVQVMIEGPGHLPLNEIQANVLLEKKLCYGAPFYVLGPLVTDTTPGYDHISSAIGGALAVAAGADFLCYVTPSEHLQLPRARDVGEGVIAAKIAAQAGEVAQGKKHAWLREQEMAKARREFNWEKEARLSVAPDKIVELLNQNKLQDRKCSMCGEFCVMARSLRRALKKNKFLK